METPGVGGVFLPLPMWPIESVAELHEHGELIDPAEYSIVGPDRQSLYRATGWRDSQGSRVAPLAGGGGDPLDYVVTCRAGWLMPGEIADWSAEAAIAAGAIVRPTAPSLYLMEAGPGGETGTEEPAWPTELGSTVVDGDVTWTAIAAQRLPEDVEDAALVTVVEWFRGGLELPRGIRQESVAGANVTYDTLDFRSGINPIPPAAAALLGAWR